MTLWEGVEVGYFWGYLYIGDRYEMRKSSVRYLCVSGKEEERVFSCSDKTSIGRGNIILFPEAE